MIGRKLNKYKEIRKNKSRYFLKKGRYENTFHNKSYFNAMIYNTLKISLNKKTTRFQNISFNL